MKWKLVSAFAVGALLASVIVYFAVRPFTNVEEPRPVASAKPSVPTHPLAPAPTAVPAPDRPVPVAKQPRPAPRIAVREKPSPFHPRVPREEPVAVAKSLPPPVVVAPPVQNISLPAPKPQSKAGPSVVLAAGMLLPIRIGQELSPERNQVGDTFFATLARPLVVDGWVIAESGATVEGHVEDKGAQNLRISIVRVATSDGQNVRIHAEPYVKVPLADVPVGAQITFKVLDPVTITERIN
ncbi:MAG TPA: hypothetical protein VFW44_07035 [Bryobacteraceae bacterium]|nr:hypothetical protein [Bryobacteraceae bacterium]